MNVNLPILAVADLHGHLTLFQKAIKEAVEILGTTDFIIVTLGDYTDNGPEIPQLFDYLIQLKKENSNFMPIIGNHDLSLVNMYDTTFFKAAQYDWWARREQLYFSYYYTKTYTQYSASNISEFKKNFPQEHLKFLLELPWYLQLNNYIFVHAGIVPKDVQAIQEQLNYLNAKDLSDLQGGWLPPQIRDKQLSTSDKNDPFIVVSGHKKFQYKQNYVKDYRITLHSGTCLGQELNCVILDPNSTSLAGKMPQFFSVFE